MNGSCDGWLLFVCSPLFPVLVGIATGWTTLSEDICWKISLDAFFIHCIVISFPQRWVSAGQCDTAAGHSHTQWIAWVGFPTAWWAATIMELTSMLCGQQSGYSSPIFQSTYLTTTFGKERHPTLHCGPPLSADSALNVLNPHTQTYVTCSLTWINMRQIKTFWLLHHAS